MVMGSTGTSIKIKFFVSKLVFGTGCRSDDELAVNRPDPNMESQTLTLSNVCWNHYFQLFSLCKALLEHLGSSLCLALCDQSRTSI